MTRVLISPQAKIGQTGGIARVVEAQVKWLPQYGVELVDRPEHADILALHASNWLDPVKPDQQTVSHCHGLYWAGYDWRSKWYAAVNHNVIEAMRQADVVTAPSEWVANSLRRGSQKPVKVIGHGVDIEDWSQAEQPRGYVYWDKSRVDPVCDPRPVNVLAAVLPQVQFVSTFGDQARNVEIVGEQSYQTNKELMRHAGLYLATTRETFGISVLEALACGVPVVGWNYAGQAEILRGTKLASYLVPVGDYDGLARAVKQALEDRHSLSSQARQLVEDKYQWKQVIKQYALLYRALDTSSLEIPKVSVVMPSYNLKDYLPQAIQSVLSQDYQDYELIIVDDCSSDGSYQIALNLAEADPGRIQVLKTPHNLYLAGALNYGIERARGHYILPLDADNLLAPGTLRTLADQLDRDRSVDIAYGKVKFIDESGQPDQSVSPDGISGWPPREFNYDAQMAHRNQIPSSSLYRKSVWSRVGGYRQRCRTAEDADFWCRATSFGAVARRVTDSVTLIYRNRQDSMSHVEKDWPWEAWYSWAYQANLTPYIASIHRDQIPVPIFEARVSVIIPVGPGHEGQGLTDALDSLMSQTYQEWEAIVVNDTGQALPYYPSWARVFDTPERRSGTSTARNIGLDNISAGSEYVVFLDADDYLDPEFLAKTLRAMSGDKEYVFTDFYKPEKEQTVAIQEFSCQDQLGALRHPITALYPRACVERLRFDSTLTVGEDWDFVLGVMAQGYCPIHVQEPLVYYRQNSGGNRQQLLQDIETIRGKLKEKWEVKMAGCGCGSRVSAPPIDNGSQEALGANSELVLMQFVQPETPTRSYTGPVTGHQYRFGSEVGHNVGYVHRADAQELAERAEFSIVTNPGQLAAVEHASPRARSR